MFKVHNGTRPDGLHPLCYTCSRGTIMRGAAESREEIYCGSINEFIKTRVVECTGYQDKRLTDLWDMRQAAWILSTDKAKNKIGFAPYVKWKEEHKYEDLLPGD